MIHTRSVQQDTFHSKGWPALVAMVMTLAGCACFIMSCVAAMVIVNRNQ